MVVINIIILLFQLAYAVKSIRDLKKDNFNFASYFYLLYAVFYIPIFWDLYLNTNYFSYTYSIVNQYGMTDDPRTMTFFNVVCFLISIAFCIGYNLNKKQKVRKRDYEIKWKRYVVVQSILLFSWLALTIVSYFGYKGNIFVFFMPVEKQVYTSTYLKCFSIIIPYAMFILKVCKDMKIYGRIKASSLGFVAVMLLAIGTTGQRREIVETVLFIALTFLTCNRKFIANIYKNNMTIRKVVKFLLFTTVLTIVLWYVRVYFNLSQEGNTDIDIVSVRTPLQVLYGSAATGFPTILAMDYFFASRGLPLFRNLEYMLTSFLPRTIYDGKLLSLTEYMQFENGLSSNLSLFYTSDVYFTFGLASVMISFIVGMVFSKIYNKNRDSLSFRFNCISLIMLSKIIMLYKNGLFSYMIILVLYVIVIVACLGIVFPKRDRGGNDE